MPDDVKTERTLFGPLAGAVPRAEIKHVADRRKHEDGIGERSNPKEPSDIEMPDRARRPVVCPHGVAQRQGADDVTAVPR
jgi:hypothetical protein